MPTEELIKNVIFGIDHQEFLHWFTSPSAQYGIFTIYIMFICLNDLRSRYHQKLFVFMVGTLVVFTPSWFLGVGLGLVGYSICRIIGYKDRSPFICGFISIAISLPLLYYGISEAGFSSGGHRFELCLLPWESVSSMIPIKNFLKKYAGCIFLIIIILLFSKKATRRTDNTCLWCFIVLPIIAVSVLGLIDFSASSEGKMNSDIYKIVWPVMIMQ